MPATTARGAFRYPEGADNSRNVRLDIQALAEDTASRTALYVESTAGTRPAAGVPGRLHRATDTGVVTWDTGTAWDDVAVSRAGGSTITASAPAVRPLTVKGAAGQTANLLEAQDSIGNVFARVTSNGVVRANVQFLAGPADTASVVGVSTSAPTDKGLVVRGAAGQAGNLQEWQSNAGTVLAAVTADANLTLNTGTVALNNAALVATTASAGGASALPGAPSGYYTVVVNGNLRKIAFWNV